MNHPEEAHLDALASIGRGTLVMLIASVVFLLFNFIGRVAVAHLVSEAAWGVFNLGVALSSLLGLVALLGMAQATARTLSYETDPVTRRRIVRTAFWVTTIDAIAISSIVYLYADQLANVFAAGHNSELALVFRMFSVTIGFTLESTFLAALFQGFERAGPNAWFNQMLNPGLFVVFLGLFFYAHLAFFGILLAYVIASGAAFAALAVYTLRNMGKLFPPLEHGPASVGFGAPREFWSLSVSLWGVNSLAFVTTFVDTLILGAFWPATQVGIYSAATTFARLFLVGNTALTYIFLPVTARLHRDKRPETIQWTYVTTTRWVVGITIPLFFLFVFLPHESLGEIFGGGYTAGDTALIILTVGAFVSIVLGPVNACMAGLGQTYTLNLTSLASASINVGLSFGLIPHYGVLGAAIAWSAARVAYPGLGALALFSSGQITAFRWNLMAPLLLAVAIGGPTFFVISLLHPHGWVIFPLFFVALGLFVGTSLATRSLNRGDLMALGFVERTIGRPLPALRRFLERFVSPDLSRAASA